MNTQSITISGVESRQVGTSTVITILADKDKYQFWSHKKDGSLSKAYEQFQKFRFQVGDTVEVAFESKQESFTGKQGKIIEFWRHTILYFKTVDEHTPSVQKTAKSQNNASVGDLEARFDKMANFCKGMDIELKALQKKVIDLESKLLLTEANNIFKQ